MESVNPIFVLPGALDQRAEAIAKGYIDSVTLGVGQFCTNPGILLLPPHEKRDLLLDAVKRHAAERVPGTMLHAGIHSAFDAGLKRFDETAGVERLARSAAAADGESEKAACTIFATDFASLTRSPGILRELFGPCSTVVRCDGTDEMLAVADLVGGQLTATLHGTEKDLLENEPLITMLRKKVGRLVFNDFPTGVEVCHAVHHGGPYPATTDSHFTSIGPSSIKRFVRPVCYQDFPQCALPAELKDENPRRIGRLVDGAFTRETESGSTVP
jgi:NADP-dependent aldehyde dehydrogenase